MSKVSFPQYKDFKHRDSMRGFYALKMFSNGYGVQVRYQSGGYYNATIVQGTQESFRPVTSPDLIAPVKPWGYTITEVRELVKTVGNYGS